MNGQNRLLRAEACQGNQYHYTIHPGKIYVSHMGCSGASILSVASHFLWRKKQKPFEIVRGNEPVSEKKYSVKDMRQLYLSSKK